MPHYTLVCPFLTDDPLYARGVEFGMLYALLRRRPRRVRDYFATENQDQILLLASRLGYAVVKIEPWEEGWFYLDLRRDTP